VRAPPASVHLRHTQPPDLIADLDGRDPWEVMRGGLISSIDERILQMAFRQASAWRYGHGNGSIMHVNVCAQDLEDAALPARVAATLRRTRIPAHALTIEITERLLISENDTVRANLVALRDIGVRLAIDDFGVGYSSLSYLRRLPVDTLKIDRSFVAEVGSTARDEAIISGIVAMARALDVRVVAEGVETVQQAAALRRLGVNAAQGWLFQPATPAADWQPHRWPARWQPKLRRLRAVDELASHRAVDHEIEDAIAAPTS